MINTKGITLILFIICLLGRGMAQPYPQYTQQPMAISPDISGGFCVMRSHHFHLGLDFRTNRQEGKSLYAIADGWVKRIKISHYGYGKLIQIQHKDGYISHYGHLSAYASPIDSYVKQIQYDRKSYEIEIFLEEGEIPVKQGQVIAYSGNSGGSTGPHLHFEIRDSSNTYVYNPLLFGIKIADTKAPILKGLRVYKGGADPYTISIKKDKYGAYYMSGQSYISASCFMNLAYNAVDPQDGSGFKNSVYHTQLFVDDKLAFEWKMDKLKIEDQRTSDYHMDYAYWVETGEYYEKLWVEPTNNLSFYNRDIAGLFEQLTNGSHTIKIKLSDFYKNTTSFSFKLNYTDEGCYQEESIDIKPANYIDYNRDEKVQSQNGELSIEIPAYTFFEDYYELTPVVTSTNNTMGEMNFTIGDKHIPLHNAFKVDIKTNHRQYPINKLCLVYYGKEGKKKFYQPSSYQGDILSVWIKDLGSFSVWADTTPPVIKKMNIRDSMYVMYNTKVTTVVTEELSDIAKYNVYIDGVWHLTEYEYKADLLTTKLPEGLSPGPHTFEIEVLDGLSNKAYRRMTIFITQNKDDLKLNKK